MDAQGPRSATKTSVSPIGRWLIRKITRCYQTGENTVNTINYKIFFIISSCNKLKWHSESADPAKALRPSDVLDRNPVIDISDR